MTTMHIPIAYISYFLVHKRSVHIYYKYMLWYGHERVFGPLQSNTVVNWPTEWDTKSLYTLSYTEPVNRECEKPTTLGNYYSCNFCGETWQSSHSSTMEAEHSGAAGDSLQTYWRACGPKISLMFYSCVSCYCLLIALLWTTEAAMISVL